MRFTVVLTVTVVLAAWGAVDISSARRTGRHAEDEQVGSSVAKKGPFAVPQATNASAPPALPTARNGSTLALGLNSTNTSNAANTTLGATVPADLNASSPTPSSMNASSLPVTPMPRNTSTVQVNASAVPGSQNMSTNASALPATPMLVNTSAGPATPINASAGPKIPMNASAVPATPMNASAGPITPMPVNVPKAMNLSTSAAVPNVTNAPSAKGAPKSFPEPAAGASSKVPLVSVASNVPAITNVSTPETAPQNGGPQVDVSQQNTNAKEAMREVMTNLNALTGLFTVPNIFQYLSDDKAEVHSPLEEFNMCTLTTRVGDERGPVTVVVAAEDEERMRAPTSFYQQSDKLPGVQRTFTSYCPGRQDVFLTFNPKRRS